MAVHKLTLDDVFEDVSCTLIALHCTIEDYRLAYLLNLHLNTGFKRKTKDLEFNKGLAKYPIFEYEDMKNQNTWNLVSNICKVETKAKGVAESLFNMDSTVVKTYNFMPGYRKVNYFLKVDSPLYIGKTKQIINKVLSIPHVAMAYVVAVESLKYKEHLIFD